MTSQYGGQSSYPAFHSAAGGSASHQQAQYTSVPTADLAALQMMWLQTMGSGRGHPQPPSEPTQSSYQLSSQPSAPWPIPTMPGQPIPGGAMGNTWLPPNVPGSAVPPFAVPHAGGNQIHPNLGQQVSEMQARQLLYMQWQQQQQQLAAGGGSSSAGFDPATGSPPGDRSSGSEAHGTEDPDITDDKRRRNTEASGRRVSLPLFFRSSDLPLRPIARFRAKKKERVTALSSKISNLENKANDLGEFLVGFRLVSGFLTRTAMF